MKRLALAFISVVFSLQALAIPAAAPIPTSFADYEAHKLITPTPLINENLRPQCGPRERLNHQAQPYHGSQGPYPSVLHNTQHCM